MRLIFLWFVVLLFSIRTQLVHAQVNYEPLHGVTGYDYQIKGELELIFTSSIDDKNGNNSEGTYHVKSPVSLAFNLNDLKFFKADPKAFIGYVENQYDAFSGYSGGALMDIPQGGYREEESWMWVDEHLKCWENGELTEVKAHGEIYPVLAGYFSIPDYSAKYKAGLDQLQFRIAIDGSSDPDFHPTRNVVVEHVSNKFNQNGAGSNLIDAEAMKELERVDPAAAAEIKKAAGLLQNSAPDLSVNINCGSFYGQDLVNALMSNNLVEADKAKKGAFECRFEQEYFKDLPRIDAMKLINYLIKPESNYEIPIVGSFFSDSEYGLERASYNGTLRFYGNRVQKSE
ncbi:MAG: hypothetical protein AB2L20_14490 [Mangrovibacterium sp.]